MIYFRDVLGACFVIWSSGHMTLCAGICRYIGGGCCEIRLSKPLLKFRSSADLKNTLLHEMIHAYLFVKYKNHDHGYHGSEFQQLMIEINCSSVADYQRPPGGYNITIYHNFVEEVNSCRIHRWMCKACGDLIKRSINIEPSENDCILRAEENQTCKHPSCHWHCHKRLCIGGYEKIAEPAEHQRKRSKRRRDNHGIAAASLKGLVHDVNRSNEKVYSGVKAGGRKENPYLGRYSTQEQFNSFLKNDPENALTDKDNSSSSAEDLQMVDDPDLSDDVEVLSTGMSEIGHSREFRIELQATNFGSHNKNKILRSHKNHSAERRNTYDVIIKWKGWYAYEEDSDSSEPLIDKRTERRKKQGSDLNSGNCFSEAEVIEGHELCLNHYSKDLADERVDTEELSRWKCNNSPKSGDMAGDQDWKEEISAITDDEPPAEVVSLGNVAESLEGTNYAKDINTALHRACCPRKMSQRHDTIMLVKQTKVVRMSLISLVVDLEESDLLVTQKYVDN